MANGELLTAGAAVFSGMVLATMIWYVFQGQPLQYLAPVAGVADASLVYWVISKNRT